MSVSASKYIADPRGYVKILVGKGHHLADTKGYAYEHRLIGEKKVGRRLTRRDVVHHLDRDRGNNDPDNLYVTTNAAHLRGHNTKHVPPPCGRLIRCVCGCGSLLVERFDNGVFRQRISGHGPGRNGTGRLKELLDAIAGADDLSGLTERERDIVSLQAGINGCGRAGQSTIARMLGLSRERIRQITNRAIRKLHTVPRQDIAPPS